MRRLEALAFAGIFVFAGFSLFVSRLVLVLTASHGAEIFPLLLSGESAV